MCKLKWSRTVAEISRFQNDNVIGRIRSARPRTGIHRQMARTLEWAIAEAFIPAAQRPLAAAWFALLHELTHAAWALEPAPGLAKLGWWQDELNGWAKGIRRHPLGEALLAQPLPWRELATALNGLAVSRETIPENPLAAVDLQPLARAIADCEAILFEIPSPAANTDSAHHSILTDALAEQALLRGEAEAATRLHSTPTTAPTTALPRRLHAAILAGRLHQLRRGSPVYPLPAWRTLISAWRAARTR